MSNQFEYTFTGDGDSDAFDYNGSKGAIFASGDIGGGTLTISASVDAGLNWYVDTDFSLTAAGFANIAETFPGRTKLRLTLTGSTTPDFTVRFAQGKGM